MKFILPTQWSCTEEVNLGELMIRPHKRVGVETEYGISYWNSIEIESLNVDWKYINEWMLFHTFVFNDIAALNWYESPLFDSRGNKLIIEGENDNQYSIDYQDISSKIRFPNLLNIECNYENLFRHFQNSSEEIKPLIKNYFNGFSMTGSISLERKVRDDSFWRILVLFSIIESIIGNSPKCPEKLTCKLHEVFLHNMFPAKTWIEMRLLEIIPDKNIADEYLNVIWEIRQKIRHRTVHNAAISEAIYIQQELGEITYDWAKVSDTWGKDMVAFTGLKIHIAEIARNLLFNKLFGINIFTNLKPLKSTRINSTG